MTVLPSLDQHDYISTYTGKHFRIFDPKPQDVCIGDIAHSLSLLCRFTGHSRFLYTVAQHSLHASYLVPAPFACEALLHDAAEAYVNDLSRPLKHHPEMVEYVNAEERVDGVIRARFGLPPMMSPEVKEIDNQLVCREASVLMVEHAWVDGLTQADVNIISEDPAYVEKRFLQRYFQLFYGR